MPQMANDERGQKQLPGQREHATNGDFFQKPRMSFFICFLLQKSQQKEQANNKPLLTYDKYQCMNNIQEYMLTASLLY